MESKKFVKELFDNGSATPWSISIYQLNKMYGLIIEDELNKRKDCFSFGDYLSHEDNKRLIQSLSEDNHSLDLHTMKEIKKSIKKSLKNELFSLFNEEKERREQENKKPEYNPDLNIEIFI